MQLHNAQAHTTASNPKRLLFTKLLVFLVISAYSAVEKTDSEQTFFKFKLPNIQDRNISILTEEILLGNIKKLVGWQCNTVKLSQYKPALVQSSAKAQNAYSNSSLKSYKIHTSKPALWGETRQASLKSSQNSESSSNLGGNLSLKPYKIHKSKTELWGRIRQASLKPS